MSCVIEIEAPFKTKLQRIKHYLFDCPSFWSIKPRFHCSVCGKGYRCFWDANDIEGVGINICNSCTKIMLSLLKVESRLNDSPRKI